MDGNRGAAFNMAADEAILRACADGVVSPTLRLYSWQRPAISVGHFQSIERSRIDIQYCHDAGIELVRRPTGGRAVLHGHDLTFSVALHECRIPNGFRKVLPSHMWLMGGIAAGLRLLGIQAEIGPASESGSPSVDNGDCFARVAQCDLRLGSEKLAGAAQVRKWGALLEQGSMPCAPSQVDYGRVFAEGGSSLQTWRSPVLEVPRETLEAAVVRGCEQSLGVTLEPGVLSARELEMALELEKNKYASGEWTYRRGAPCIDKRI
ncbi:MAG TPA: biotin/lipoate A/B protein ligase family protein [Armatimonadota bacterium]|nr:biotin/lipoate A/B protein ligase family protein [Armatimonadota bacterium]